MHGSMKRLVRRFVDENEVNSHDDMERIGLTRTRRQIADVMKRVTQKKNPRSRARCLGRSFRWRQVRRGNNALEQIAGSRAARRRQPLPACPDRSSGFDRIVREDPLER